MRTFLYVITILFLITDLRGQNLETLLKAGAGNNATIFAKGIISDGLNNRDFVLSPDENEIFYTIQSAKFLKSTIVRIRKINGQWQKPEIAPFSGRYRDLEASFSPDGKTIYFSSDRPVNESDITIDFDIWKVERLADGWGSPVHLGFIVNSAKNEFYPSITKTGNLYFTTIAQNGYGEEDIVKCPFVGGRFSKRELLDTTINTKGDEFNGFVDPDENYIIFSSYKGRPDDLGGGDLYISRKTENNMWGPAVNMGAAINSTALDYCPFVSADKKKLYFSSNRNQLVPRADQESYESFISLLKSAGNSFDDIYVAAFDPAQKE